MDLLSIIRIYPTVEELSNVNSKLNCSECAAVFQSESNLNMHLAKTHKHSNLLQPSTEEKLYYCPILTCNYNKISSFKSFKNLKQHYLKVHAYKNFICKLCNAGFSTESYRNRHTDYCNINFQCCDCDLNYSSYESLKTHSRRKRHRILEKLAYKNSEVEVLLQKSETLLTARKNCFILPKPSSSASLLENCPNTGIQTEKCKQSNQGTQTFIIKMPPMTVETQTNSHFFVKKPEGRSLCAAATQTPLNSPKTVSCNTSFNLDENKTKAEVKQSSSGTQTFCQSEQILGTHDFTSDTSNLLKDTLDTNFFNCNSETQTDFMFNDELLKYNDDYSNMYTQTCEDLLLDEIGLNNTQTQTVFDYMLKSVESQTVISQWRKLPLSCKDISHMETQTDAGFKEMLEEINA